MKSRRSEPHECPVESCTYESSNLLDLQRHMVESERSNTFTGHHGWLTDALGAEFAEYAFKMDRKVAKIFSHYYRHTGKELPSDPMEFYYWFQNEYRRKNG